jgi:NTE family protein
VETITLGKRSFTPNMRNNIRERLKQYFGELSKQEIDAMEWVRLKKGEYLFRQGDEGKDMFVLIAGKMQVYLEDPLRLIGAVYAGECVGETSLISEAVRSASVLALRDAALVRISAENFAKLWKQRPEVMLNLSRTIIKRLNMKNRGVHFKPSACRLICISGLDLQSQVEIASKTASYWASDLKVKVIQEGDVDLSQLHTYIDELEGSEDLVILLGAGSKEWQTEIIHHSDQMFYLAREADVQLFNIPPHTPSSVVLLYNENEVVDKVAPWLQQFSENHVFRVRKNLVEDQERLARILAGRAVCWVFGGGGAHGFAHLGAVRALKEYGIPVDMVAGTSFGSIIAACFALGWDVENTIVKMREELSVKNPLNDYTLPMVALVRGKKMGRLLQKYFNIPAENTWKNFFCIAANLSANKAEIIGDGPLDRAIRASTAIPGILPPQIYRKGNHG